MSWMKQILLGLLSLLMLAVTAAYLTPLDIYAPDLEQALSGQLHEPVSIRHLRFDPLPLPHLELQEVRLGGKELITAQSVDVRLNLSDLLTGRSPGLSIVIKDGMASYTLVRKLVDLFSDSAAPVQYVALRELQLSRMGLITPGIILGQIEGKLDFTQDGKLERMWFAMDERRITTVMLPLPGQHFSVMIQAHDWSMPQFPQFPMDDLQVEGVFGKQDFVAQKFTIASRGIHATGSGKVEFSDGWRIRAALSRIDAPLKQAMDMKKKSLELTGAISAKGVFGSEASTFAGLKDNFQFSGEVMVSNATARMVRGLSHPLVFDQIRMSIVVQPQHIEFKSLEARLYGGMLSGTMNIDRKDNVLAARLAANGIAMQSLVEALTNEVLFTGSMDGEARFSIRLDKSVSFPENTQLSGNFILRNGVLTKVDLLQAENRMTGGGVTRFDDLSGLLTIDASGCHFRKLKIASGSLNADGNVDVSPSLQLDGMLDVDITGTAGLVSMQMVVSGMLNEPVVRPSGSALAGAAVGTAILGHGIGTAVGIKAGGFLNRLFDRNGGSDKDAVPRTPVRK